MSGLYISAANKSSGKTTVTLGLCRALRRRGIDVQPFKKGPDYIDPMWLSVSSGRPCYNLDFNTQDESEILNTYQSHSKNAGLSIVEGNKGLFDGLDVHGSDSNAAMAKLLGLGVILVIDVQGITRGIAPLLNGYSAFDPDIRYVGVILNKVGGSRHEKKLRDVIAHYTDFSVLGAIHRNQNLVITERHLGLLTNSEDRCADEHISRITDEVESRVDLNPLTELVSVDDNKDRVDRVENNPGEIVKIGVARDSAFNFYYADDLDSMTKLGADVVFFSPLEDQNVPEVDALYIGGGFPETHCSQLEMNQSMKRSLQLYFKSGKPIYAECGGLMYLARSIVWQGRKYEMAGIIPSDVEMQDRPVGRGYMQLQTTIDFPWSVDPETQWNAHEFHYSRLVNVDPALRYGYYVERGFGIDGRSDGIVMGNLFASYAHLRSTNGSPWVEKFIQFIQTRMH
jgi:cobyrinic acid a,c-diamide synthase